MSPTPGVQIQQQKLLLDQLQGGLQAAEESMSSFEQLHTQLKEQLADSQGHNGKQQEEAEALRETLATLQEQVDQLPGYCKQLVKAKEVRLSGLRGAGVRSSDLAMPPF